MGQSPHVPQPGPVPQTAPPTPGQLSYPPPQGPVSPSDVARAAARRRRVVWLAAGGAALVILVGAVATALVTRTASQDAAAPAKATTSASAVKGYLRALAAGDADTAKQYALNAPADSPLLTNDFLRASLDKNPITDVQVDAEDDLGTVAIRQATYKIGSTLVQGSFTLTKVSGVWKLNAVTTAFSHSSSWGALAPLINGVAAPTTGDVQLFPGVYALSTGSTLLGLEQGTLTVKAPEEVTQTGDIIRYGLTQAGVTAARAKAKAWLEQCLPIQELDPKNCGMSLKIPNGGTLAAGSVTRTVEEASNGVIDRSVPTLVQTDPTKVSIPGTIRITVTSKDTAGNAYSATTSVTTMVGTISGDTMTVIFED